YPKQASASSRNILPVYNTSSSDSTNTVYTGSAGYRDGSTPTFSVDCPEVTNSSETVDSGECSKELCGASSGTGSTSFSDRPPAAENSAVYNILTGRLRRDCGVVSGETSRYSRKQ